MSEVCRVEVRWDPNRTTPNRTSRLHWGPMTRLKDRAKQEAWLAWLAAGRPEASGPVRLSLVVRRGRVMDEDNIWSGLKWCRDQLFNRRKHGYGITPDDGPQWVRLGEIRQETGRRWVGEEHVVLIVETLEP